MNTNNLYQPNLMRIINIVKETADTKTFKLEFQDSNLKENFAFQAGQFGLYSVFGQGEAPFCLASSPLIKEYIECSVKKVGKLTAALHNLEVGDVIGFRGPYGRGFPISEMKHKNLIFVGGGIGLAPLRGFIQFCLEKREDFKDITIIYGARTPADLVYKEELIEWKKRGDIELVLTVDPGGEDKSWEGRVGFVPTILEEVAPSAEDAVVITCGPPIMIKFVLKVLEKLKFKPESIFTTLEMRMKCGIGKCGRCNIGNKYVCKDGPVFSYKELLCMPKEY